MTRLPAVLFALALLGWSSLAPAQPTMLAQHGEVTLFSDPDFKGHAFHVAHARERLHLPFRARSFLIAPGDVWQVCANPDFRTPCTQVDHSNANWGWFPVAEIHSIRPVRATTREAGFAGSADAGPSLKGMVSEFFRAPRDRGMRVVACPSGPQTPACAAD